MSSVSGFIELGKKVTIFTGILDILDTAFAVSSISTGVNYPSFVYFAPKSLYSMIYNLSQTSSNMSTSPLGILVFFVFLVFPSFFIALANLIIGIVAGLPLFVWGVGSAIASAVPMAYPVTLFFTVIAIFLQSLSDIFVVYVFLGLVMP